MELGQDRVDAEVCEEEKIAGRQKCLHCLQYRGVVAGGNGIRVGDDGADEGVDVAAADRVIPRQLVVDTQHRLRIVVVERHAVADFAARIGGRRQALRDLQRVCTFCDSKRRCRNELDDGDAASTYAGFCPNAVTLKGLT